MDCGHNEGCMYRFRHRGVTHKYCMACICEKSGVNEVGNNPNYKPAGEKFQEREKLKEEVIKKEETKKEVKVEEEVKEEVVKSEE